MTKRNTKYRRRRKLNKGKKTRKMRGGAFTPEQRQNLLDLGFTEQNITELSNMDIDFSNIQISLNQVNPNTGAPFTPNELIESMNEQNDGFSDDMNLSSISNESDDNPILNDMDMDISGVFDEDSIPFNDEGSLHLSDLDIVNDSMEANTTLPDESLHLSDISDVSSVGGRRKRRTKSRKGKTKRQTKRRMRRTRKQRMKRRMKQTRKQRGGMCYGNGVGANSYDPNYSIYNTRQLELFPYRPK